jgi:hypothetical protein
MTLLFNWQMENTGTAEYSAGDAVGSNYGTVAFDGTIKQAGSYSIKCTNAGGYYFDISSLDIVKNTGAIVLYLYGGTFHATTGNVFVAYLGSYNNAIEIYTYDITGTKYVCARYTGNSTAVGIGASVGNDVATGQWYKVTLRWRLTGSPNLSLQVGTNTPVTDDTDLTAFAVSSGTLYVGPLDSGMTVYLDNLKIYDDWDATEGGGGGGTTGMRVGILRAMPEGIMRGMSGMIK